MRYIFVIFDNFSEYLWCIQVTTKNSQRITQEVSNILSTSKRRPIKIESDRGAEFYNSISKTSWKLKIYNTIKDSQIKVHQ